MATAVVIAPIVQTARGVYRITWDLTATMVAGQSNVLTMGNYDYIDALFVGPTGGTSAMSLEGAPTPTGPFHVLSSVSGQSLAFTNVTGGITRVVHEHANVIRLNVTAAPTKACQAVLTFKENRF